jgi:phytoene dehydrogenase-like protein
VNTERRVRGDLRFLRIYALTIPTVMRYRPDAAWAALSAEPGELLTRLESELAGEASRYRALLVACIAVLLMPGVLAAFMWSGLYWLPLNVIWLPFFRGEYGLPWLSLFEWLAFLLLVAFLVYGWALLRTSRTETRRMAADLAVIGSAPPVERGAIAREALDGNHPRSELLLRKAVPLSAYRELLTREASP